METVVFFFFFSEFLKFMVARGIFPSYEIVVVSSSAKKVSVAKKEFLFSL